MLASRTTGRSLPRLGAQLPLRPRHRAFASRPTSAYAIRRQQHFVRSIVLVTTAASLATAYQWYAGGSLASDVHAEGPAVVAGEAEKAEIVFEKARKPKGATKEATRDAISSQHLQVRKSWENPGVWCWGVNDGRVAAPDAKDGIVRNPRWMPFFDGVLLRDMKLQRDSGAAITEDGDLLQWGSAYSANEANPVKTLTGKNLVSLSLSKDRVLALSKSGQVYSLSVSQEEQALGPKPEEKHWLPFMSSRSPVSYRTITPTDLAFNETVSQIAGGLDHLLILTTKGRVFSAAAGSDEYPTHGELGVPGLTWFTKPAGPYDQPHEITALRGFPIAQVAAGDHHSLALDRQGRLFAWGDNGRGQLGIGDTSKDTPYFDTPALLPIVKLYAGTQSTPIVTSVHAGGNTTFLTVDAKRHQTPDGPRIPAGRGVTADTWACGHGIWGQLGNGRWTHVQSLPTKIAPLSGLFEYDERARRAVPIRLRDVSVGANHCAATMDNVTYLSAGDATNENDTNWGADVLFFGNNEFYQLGTGKRNNVVTPTYIQPLDRVAEVKEGKRPKQEEHRFHATPRSTVRLGERWVSFEQRVVCGRGVTAVYSGV